MGNGKLLYSHMYIFSDFAKLIILLLVIAIVFLTVRRRQRKNTEGPDTGDKG